MSDPAEKYRDRVDPEHVIAMQAIGLARMALEQHRARFATLLESRRHLDSVGHILNPTLFRDAIHSKGLAQQIKLSGARLLARHGRSRGGNQGRRGVSAQAFSNPDFGKEVRVEQWGCEVRLIFVAANEAKADALVANLLDQLNAGGLNLTLMGRPTSVTEEGSNG
jgi:hypothetical protein